MPALGAAPARGAGSVYVGNVNGTNVSQYAVGLGGGLAPKSPATVMTGELPVALAVSPDGRSVYVADEGSNAVSQYDVGADGALLPKSPEKVAAGEHPEGIAVSPDGRSVYVANFSANTVSQYDVVAGGALAPKSPAAVPAGTHPVGVAVTPEGRSVYVANEGEKTAGVVSQYDAAPSGALASKVPSTVAAGNNAYGVLVSPDGKSVYVANEDSTVSQYDVGATGVLAPKAPASFSVAGGLSGMAISPDGRSAYLSNPVTNMISQDDVGASGMLTPKSPPTVAGGAFPGAIAVTPDQGPIASFSGSALPTGSPSAFDGSGSSDPDGAVARYDWSFGDGTSAPNAGARPAHTYGAAGSYTVTLQVTDDAGCSTQLIFTGQTAYCNGSAAASTTRTLTVAPPVATTLAPTVSSLSETAKTWREGHGLARISANKRSKKKKLPVGTTFSFSLNEPASVTFTFSEPASGRKVGKTCVAPTRKNKKKHRCTRVVVAGTLTFSAHAGTNKVRFEGVISRHERLGLGSYTLRVTATASGKHSTTRTLHFTIAKR